MAHRRRKCTTMKIEVHFRFFHMEFLSSPMKTILFELSAQVPKSAIFLSSFAFVSTFFEELSVTNEDLDCTRTLRYRGPILSG